jgi:hypothetical protein
MGFQVATLGMACPFHNPWSYRDVALAVETE